MEFEEMLNEFLEEHPNKSKPKRKRKNKYKDYKKKALIYKDYPIRKNIKSKHYDYKDLKYEDIADLELYAGDTYIESIDISPMFGLHMICELGEKTKQTGVFKFSDIDKITDSKEAIENIFEFINNYYRKIYSNRFYHNLYDRPFLGGYGSLVEYSDKEKKLLNFFDKYNKINNFYSKMEIDRSKGEVRRTLKEEVKRYNNTKEVDTDKIHKVISDEEITDYIL